MSEALTYVRMPEPLPSPEALNRCTRARRRPAQAWRSQAAPVGISRNRKAKFFVRIPASASTNMLMRNTRLPRQAKAFPTLAALEERVSLARVRLQRTTENDPAFERRLKALVELVRKRDDAVVVRRIAEDHNGGACSSLPGT